MKRSICKALGVVILLAVMGILGSCRDKTSPDPQHPGNQGIALAVYENVQLGWGKGAANGDAYISFSNGVVATYRTVHPQDRATQEAIDMVLPGDWGSSGGSLVICAPVYGSAGYELCKDWQVKKGTWMKSIGNGNGVNDIRDFENLKTDLDVMAVYDKMKIYSGNWDMFKEGDRFIFKTEEGIMGIAYIHQINGTYGSTTANTTISFKMIRP